MPTVLTPATPDLIASATPAPAHPPVSVASTHFRLRAIMRQGTAASLPPIWERYPTMETARAAVRGLYANDRVLRVMIVADDVPPRFMEWVER